MGLQGASFRLLEFIGAPVGFVIKDQVGALHKGRVRSKFSVGQGVKKEILVEEVAL